MDSSNRTRICDSWDLDEILEDEFDPLQKERLYDFFWKLFEKRITTKVLKDLEESK